MANPGKFEASGAIGELLWNVSLHGGPDEEVGDVDEFGIWYGIMFGPFDLKELSDIEYEATEALSSKDREKLKSAKAAIISTDSQGFVDVELFSSKKQAKSQWRKIEKDLDSSDSELSGSRASSKKPGRLDWYDWRSFADQAGEAFWAEAYIQQVEELSNSGHREAYRALSPGPGGNWETVLPVTPSAAYKMGRELADKIRAWISEDDLRIVESKMSVDKAGYYAAMQAMGHGVGWFDYGVDVNPKIHMEPYDLYDKAISTVKKALREEGIKVPKEW